MSHPANDQAIDYIKDHCYCKELTLGSCDYCEFELLDGPYDDEDFIDDEEE